MKSVIPKKGLDTKAVTFTHLPVPNFEEFRIAATTGKLGEHIKKSWGSCIQAFDKCDSIHLVYLFLSDAYKAYVTGAPNLRNLASLEVAIKAELNSFIQQQSQNPGKFQLVGLEELSPLLKPLDNLATNSNIALRQLVLGGGSELYYDCPKVVEAIIRIARRDKREPILRFDADVAVENQAVQQLIDQYERLVDNKQYFFFSGSYFYHNESTDPQMFWLNDYSVRPHFLSTGPGGEQFGYYRGMTGIDPDSISFTLDTVLARHFISQIPLIGANVYAQPISGAGLCISRMAIVQLPPFANVARNVMWIDDSIKRTLHEGIGDINVADTRTVQGARFAQNRYPNGVKLRDVQWAYNTYLPRLVYGCLMHGLMFDAGVLPPAGPYANSFTEYMRTRRIPTKEDRSGWSEVAINRINVIKEIWSDSSFSSNNAGQMLVNFATEELDINQNGCGDIIIRVVENPRVDINQPCQNFSLPPERNAGAYIAQAIADLQRYIDLMELWPYIIRTIDFETRNPPPNLQWLVRD